jgi:hypothetical protein
MLRDHRLELERCGRRARDRRELPKAFGNFMAHLTEWDWFINPVTFRDLRREFEQREIGIKRAAGYYTIYDEDPRLTIWRPSWRKQSWRWGRQFGPPVPALALAQIKEFLAELQASAGQPIGWVIGEEFGSIGGRYHCHVLITGVKHLQRDEWWQKAYERFGRTRIEPFDPQRAAAYYTAKYAAKQLGGLHFGGSLAGIDLSRIEERAPRPGGKVDVTRSADMPRTFFHNTLSRWHR